MNCLICEGNNDRYFFHQCLFRFSADSGYQISNNISDFSKIFQSRYHPYHKLKYSCIIFGEGGKRKLFERVVMQFVRELFGKTKEELRFFVVIDNDGTEDEKLLDTYAKSIQNSLNSRGLNRYSCKYYKKLSCFEIYSDSDSRLKCYVKVFHIPQSLESELVKKCIVKCRYSPSIQNKLAQMNPHDALKRITEDKGLPLEDLIRESVNEGWFSDELWFKKVIHDISLMFSLDTRDNSTR